MRKLRRFVRNFMREEEAVGVVEIILILGGSDQSCHYL